MRQYLSPLGWRVLPVIFYHTWCVQKGSRHFFVQVFRIDVGSWKFNMLLLYILWDGWPIFMILGSKELLQQQLKYTLLIPDCHSWWISKMQSGCEDTLEKRYAIKFVLNLEMAQKPMECFRLLLDYLAWIEHQFLSGIRDSSEAGNLWGMMRGVGGVKKSIHKSWLAKEFGLGSGLICWDFKRVQEEIPSEEASTLQIGSVAFPPGQCTRLLTCSHKRTSMGPSRSCCNGTTSALQPEEITSKRTGVSFVYYQ